ncbi:hypothetical protein HAX54_025865 [Datura stramonium]|uniref:Uncharacterized protein n=1 Tax=Datura stramonium TaxID=4076 RepID=A0ABS8V2D8_DATST|nr:hypothetical protein [Datura stramonium]
MKGNSLQGTIPNLEDLPDLRSGSFLNSLSGPIPHFIANLTSLLYLNLSFNKLEGEVPVTGIFSNLSADVLIGNSELCGGIQELHLRPCVSQKTQKKHVLALKFILTIVFAASFSILALLVVFLCWRRNLKDQPEPEDRSKSARCYPNISYEELRIATGGFSSENLIGSGSFGTVYKGTFASDGMVVAVKENTAWAIKVSILGDILQFWDLILEKVMEILDKEAFHGDMTSKATNGEEYWASIKKEQMEATNKRKISRSRRCMKRRLKPQATNDSIGFDPKMFSSLTFIYFEWGILLFSMIGGYAGMTELAHSAFNN